MASWKEERDRLVAQTLAFVQDVAAAHPIATQRLNIWQPPSHAPSQADSSTATVTPTVATDTNRVTTPDLVEHTTAATIEPSERCSSDALAATTPTDALPQARQHPLYSGPSERAEILKRVASFKARQTRMIHEREAYYETMQTRIRTTLGNETGRGRL